MEYFYIGIIILSSIANEVMYRRLMTEIDEHTDTLNQLRLALDRENYLLKTMNDSLSVSDMAGFIAQRMRNAPKEFEPKTDEEIKPDRITS